MLSSSYVHFLLQTSKASHSFHGSIIHSFLCTKRRSALSLYCSKSHRTLSAILISLSLQTPRIHPPFPHLPILPFSPLHTKPPKPLGKHHETSPSQSNNHAPSWKPRSGILHAMRPRSASGAVVRYQFWALTAAVMEERRCVGVGLVGLFFDFLGVGETGGMLIEGFWRAGRLLELRRNGY